MFSCIIACSITKFVKSECMHVCIFFVCVYVLYMRGGLSLYSFSQNQPTLSILNEEPINEDIEFKTLDGKRNYDLFRRIISDQNKVRSFTSPDFKYEEADIVLVNNASNGFTKEHLQL